jgi:sodium-dependent dicarboxylate transporter 2/3/5
MIPMLAAVAPALGVDAMTLVVACALASSLAFMLPVGTPPNAIVFGSGQITLPQMARAGLLLNILLVPVILAIVLLLGPAVFDLAQDVVPEWARSVGASAP